MTKSVWKFFFCSLPTQWRFKFLEKTLICFKKKFCQKTTNKQNLKLSKVKFSPKLNMQNSGYTKPLSLEL